MNDIEFIETLKQKRNACDYSQSRLAQELQISRQNLNEIENGKTKASKEMKHILLHYLDYCNCTQPFTLTIDYLRVRFPTTDALEIIKNVLAMKSEYFIHEDYGMFGYEEQYIYGDISVNASKDSSMGVFSRNPEQIIASLILTQIDFPVYILWDIFLDNVTTSLPFIMTPVAVNMDKTKRWLERQVMPSLLMIKEIEKQTGANYLEEIDRHTRLTEKQELKIKQMTTDIADMIEKDTAVPQGNDGIF